MITLTDEELVCALECCGVYHSCTSCPFYEDSVDGKDCLRSLQTYALDRINKLEVECADKERAYNDEFSLRKDLQDENKKLLKKVESLSEVLSDSIRIKYAEAKAEAYKEFADKLDEKLDDCDIISDGEYSGYFTADLRRCIEEVLKETVG